MKKENVMVSSNQLTQNALKEHKRKVGEVVLVAISPRTTIELPASLSLEEREIRIELYKKLHTSKV